MTAEALAPPSIGFGRWARHLTLLGLAAAALLVLRWDDAAAIVGIWERTGAFHHCFLLPPILVWLVWQRRQALATLVPGYSLAGAAVVALGGMLWLLGAAAYVELLRQAGLVVSAQGLVIALLGRQAARVLAFPLGFALFLIPVGSEFEPLLQVITARIAVVLLHLVDTAATLEGVFIETPAGLFRVAEACSGTAFLLAMAAYGALVSAMCFQSWRRRAMFVAAAMLAALLTNGVRAFGIMELANRTSIRNPAVQDHLLYGWLLFAIVLAALMLVSARWFDRDPDAPYGDPGKRTGPGRAIALPAILAALLLPPLWLAATEPATGAVPPPPVAPRIPGWALGGGESDWHPHFEGATWIGQWRYRRGAERVDFAVILFDRQAEGRELVAFGQGAVAPEDIWATMAAAPPPPDGRAEWLRGPDGRVRHAETFYVIDGMVTGSRIVAKLAAAKARLLGGDTRAVAILLSTEDRPEASAAFLSAAGAVTDLAQRALPPTRSMR